MMPPDDNIFRRRRGTTATVVSSSCQRKELFTEKLTQKKMDTSPKFDFEDDQLLGYSRN
jgi:hypothetical protein